MHRSFWLRIFFALAMIITPLVGSVVFPPDIASAEVAVPNANPDLEIIVLESNGRIRVDDPYVPPGVQQVVWNSGADIGWEAIAAGDFNGDGTAEIVAIRGGTLKVFDPVTPTGVTPVSFEYTLPAGRTFRLVVTGDFDGDGRDEIAAAHTDSVPGTGVVESIKVFDGGPSGTTWAVVRDASYGAPWIEMATGDVNADGRDDLVLFRGYDYFNLVKVYNGANWSTLAESNFTFSWLALAVGNISAAYPGAEIALTRSEVLGELDSVILLRLSGNSLVDLPADRVVNRKFYPYFRSIVTGDLNGDGDHEVILLRDPTEPRVSLLALNPNGVAMRDFEQAIGYGGTAWKLVRAGDIDGDGRDEIVVLRGDRYRIYTEPELSDNFQFPETLGSFLVSATPSNRSTMVLADVDGAGQFLGPTLGVTPASLTFNLEYRQPSPTQTVRISNVGTADVFAWQAQVVEGANWLRINRVNGVTPADLGVSVDTTAVAPGTYTGKIRVSATTAGVVNTPQDITVTLTLTGVALQVTPKALSFNVEYGQPAPQQFVNIRSAGGSSAINWQAEVLAGQTWLQLGATQGITPSTLGVSVNSAAVPPGSYIGTIQVRTTDPQVADPIQYVTVNLTVPDPGFVVLPAELTLLQKFGAPAVTRNVTIWWPGRSVNWTATPVPAQNLAAVAEMLAAGETVAVADLVAAGGYGAEATDWLVLSPASGVTQPNAPSTMTVSIKPGTALGTYEAFIIITAPGADAPKYVKVTGIVAGHIPTLYLPLIRQ